jgi:hypothetical protein
MKGKLILALIIIFGLLGFAYFQGYFKNFNLPSIQPSKLVGNFLIWMEELIWGRNEILIITNLTFDSFNGKEITFKNSSFIFIGKCTSFIDLNGILINQKDNGCNLNAEIVEGKILFKEKVVKVELKTKQIDLNNSQYFGDLKIAFSAIPLDVKIGKIIQTLSFEKAWGEVKKLRADGNVDEIKMLYGNSLEIRNFEGTLWIQNNYILLTGKTSKLKW